MKIASPQRLAPGCRGATKFGFFMFGDSDTVNWQSRSQWLLTGVYTHCHKKYFAKQNATVDQILLRKKRQCSPRISIRVATDSVLFILEHGRRELAL